MAASESLTVTQTLRDGCTVLIAAGDIDLATHSRLRAALAPAIDSGRPVVTDLTRIQFMDSSGCHTLVHARKVARNRDREVPLVIVPSTAVSRVLELTGLDQVLTVSATVADALAALHQRAK